MAIVTWEYYNSLYGNAGQSQFTDYVGVAERQVQLVVGYRRWSAIDESAFYYDQLRDCICKVIDKLIELDKSGLGKGLASVSNDGYTENYVIRTSSEVDAEIRGCIIRWLSGTGLASAYPLEGV